MNNTVLSKNSLRYNSRQGFFSEIWNNKFLYLLAAPGILYFVIFSYIPMFGITIAFKDYNIAEGILASKWNGIENFKFFFTSGDAFRITRNTLFLNVLFIFFSHFFGIALAIFINDIRSIVFKKVSQTVMFLPYFVSWIIVGLMSMGLFSTNEGTINSILKTFSIEPISWYTEARFWPAILVILNVWKWAGYNSIIYLASISSIDLEIYEASEIDGASKIKQLRHITLPLLIPTVTILILLAIGRIFYGDFAMIYGIVGDNGMLFPTTDVIDTYVFRALRQMNDFGMAAAIGLYQSVFGFIVIMLSNYFVKKHQEDGALF